MIPQSFPCCLSVGIVCVVLLFLGFAGNAFGEIKIPLTVRTDGAEMVDGLPVWTGVPLPEGAVTDPDTLRLLGPDSKATPAQFDIQARWADGSIKWVLVTFFADRSASTVEGQYILTADGDLEAPAHPSPIQMQPDTNDLSLSTGPLRLRFSRHAFHGLNQAWLDLDQDGTFTNIERISPDRPDAGIVAVDANGKTYTSALGQVSKVEIERSGPLHAVIATHGDLRSAEGGESLLLYAMRVHAFAGTSLTRVVLTIHNPRSSGRPNDGARWVLGQSGAVLLESLEFVQPMRFIEGQQRVTLAADGETFFDRIPLAETMAVYQDSSGGENWFHRTHVERDDRIPLRFRGYQVSYGDRAIDTGLRASPWVDVSDTHWAVSLAVPGFWQNFPKRLAVDTDGTLRLGLWPQRDTAPHEIQGGEQKTHEFWVYFRHRRRENRDDPMMPLARDLMPTCVHRPWVTASAEAYCHAEALDAIVPWNPDAFPVYEAAMASAVRDRSNLFTHREWMDEYGWRNFGDTPAANERNQTEGPHQGLNVVSHYNNEYDLGFGMLLQALRTVDGDTPLARGWWHLGLDAVWHEADIDIYHTLDDIVPVYNGGTFTHTSHGVEAGRSTHRGAPMEEEWGRLDWSWARGSTPEAGHFRSRGILTAWLLTGDRHLLDAANDVRDLVVYKIGNDAFPQITNPGRDTGNNLQILLDAYLLTWEEKYLKLAEKAAAASSYDAVQKRTGEAVRGRKAWGYGLYLKNLHRLLDIQAKRGGMDEALVSSYLQYARDIREKMYAQNGNRWQEGNWSIVSCDAMMFAADLTDDPAERKAFLEAARNAFAGLEFVMREDGSARFINSKATTMHLQGGGAWMQHVLDESGEKDQTSD